MKCISSLDANTTYYVRAYATNSFGTVYGNEQNFTTLVGVPKACFECASNVGYKVTFTNCSEYPTSCLWDFGDGTTSIENAPTHVYNSVGTYNVKLTVSNDGLSDFIIKSVVISDIVNLNETKVPASNTYPYVPTSIDVDFDGIADLVFSTSYSLSPNTQTAYYSSSISVQNNYKIICDSISYSYFHKYDSPSTTTIEKEYIPRIYLAGNSILNSGTAKAGIIFLSSYHSSSFSLIYNINIWNKDEIRYIGFYKVSDGKTKIGWIKLKVLNYFDVTLYSYKIPTESESLIISSN